jgi:hypothetical protein
MNLAEFIKFLLLTLKIMMRFMRREVKKNVIPATHAFNQSLYCAFLALEDVLLKSRSVRPKQTGSYYAVL